MRQIPKVRNLIIKIGSNVLTDSAKEINAERLIKLTDVIAKVKNFIPRVTLVSSGAVAAGFKLLGFDSRPKSTVDKQACASLGQARLMWYYEQALNKHNLHAAQILITKHDFSNRKRYLNAKATIERLLELNVVPIINENDVVVVNELKYIESFGDNDNLSTLVAGLIDSDMLLILSDVDGLFTADPSKDSEAKLISDIADFSDDYIKLAGSSSSGVGTGGMKSKLLAAQKALSVGCNVCILNGKDPENIIKFFEGQKIGTFFKSSVKLLAKRKHWLLHATIPKGTIYIDEGASEALKERHSSLLFRGILKVEGDFYSGDIVAVKKNNEEIVGLGKVRFNSMELNKFKQLSVDELEKSEGRAVSSIVIHYDDLGFF